MGLRCFTAVLIISRIGPEMWAVIGLAVGILGIGVGIGYMNGSITPGAVNVAMLVLGLMCVFSNVQSVIRGGPGMQQAPQPNGKMPTMPPSPRGPRPVPR